MPEIKEYTAGAAITPTETGIESTAAAARRGGQFFNQIAASKEQIGHEADQTIKGVGETALQYLDFQQVNAASAKFSKYQADKVEQWNSLMRGTKDPNQAHFLGKQFTDEMEPELQDFIKGMGTQRSREWMETHADNFRQHMQLKTTADTANMAKDAVSVNAMETANNLSNLLRKDPVRSTLDFSIAQFDDALDAQLRHSGVNAEAAGNIRTTYREKMIENMVKSAAVGHIEMTNGESLPEWLDDPKYSKYVNPAELTALQRQARYYQRGIEGENRANRTFEKQEVDRKSSEKAEEYRHSLYDEDGNFKADPKFISKINRDDSLKWSDRNALRTMYSNVTKNGARETDTPGLVSELLSRVRLPDDNPAHLKREDLYPLIDAPETDRHLTQRSATFLMGLMKKDQQDIQTPWERDQVLAARKEMEASLRKKVQFGDSAGNLTPQAAHSMAQWDAWFFSWYPRMRKRGIDAEDLLFEGGQHYWGKVRPLESFIQPIKGDDFNSRFNTLNAPANPPAAGTRPPLNDILFPSQGK